MTTIEEYKERIYTLQDLYEKVQNDKVITIKELGDIIQTMIDSYNQNMDNQILEMYEWYQNRYNQY